MGSSVSLLLRTSLTLVLTVYPSDTCGRRIRSRLGSALNGMVTLRMPSAWRTGCCTCKSSAVPVYFLRSHYRGRMTTAFVDFNGVVPEKFDAVKLSHLVDAEYGNQGVDFKMVPREGFGWMNGTFCSLRSLNCLAISICV